MAELIEDEYNKGIRIATITNEHERIVRLVNKFNMAVRVEVMYLMPNQYQWINESIGIGIEELIELGRLARLIKSDIDIEEGKSILPEKEEYDSKD